MFAVIPHYATEAVQGLQMLNKVAEACLQRIHETEFKLNTPSGKWLNLERNHADNIEIEKDNHGKLSSWI